MNQKLFIFILAILGVIYLMAISTAITASIGAARMVIKTQPNVTIEKYILVENVNQVLVNVTVIVSGDLANYTNLSKNFLTILPHESERVNFTTFSPFIGNSTTQILFTFSHGNEQVGIKSIIIVLANNNTAKSCDKRDRECRKICFNTYMEEIKDCNTSYSFFVKYCSNERLEKREICAELRGQERIECVKNLNVENKLCKKDALEAKTACRIRARTALLLCKG